jgi:hypothetical protein
MLSSITARIVHFSTMKTSILAAFVTAGSAMAASVLPPSLEGREIKPSGDGPTAITTNLVYADGM